MKKFTAGICNQVQKLGEQYKTYTILLNKTMYLKSEISMAGIKAPFTVRLLEGGGHYPMEEPALTQLITYADEFIKSLN